MRKLASIQRVAALLPIEGADLIELAQINGWQAVVKKGEFQVGDLGTYLEIDAIPPARPEFAFLWKGKVERPGNLRIKTVKLRGCLSQGLLLPLSALAETAAIQDPTEDQDVTELLGVLKYEPPQPGAAQGHSSGTFPHDIPKTDEDRVQSNLKLLRALQGKPYCITLKCDGSSGTFTIKDDDTFAVCSRNHQVAEDEQNIYWQVARLYHVEAAMRARPGLALQGEVVGPGIQGNKMGLKQVEFRAFNLYDKRTRQHCSQEGLELFCSIYGIPCAPVIESGQNFQHTLESLLALAEGKYQGTTNEREGIVIRSIVTVENGVLLPRISFKAISNRFLLKGGD